VPVQVIVPPPIQKISRPQGSFMRVSDSEKNRLPSFVTRIPSTSEAGTAGRLMLSSISSGKLGTLVIRCTSCTSSGRYVPSISG